MYGFQDISSITPEKSVVPYLLHSIKPNVPSTTKSSMTSGGSAEVAPSDATVTAAPSMPFLSALSFAACVTCLQYTPLKRNFAAT